MRSSSETGHAKNVANFGKLISFTREMGTAYQPSHPELQLSALEGLLAKARQSLDKAAQTKLKYDNAVIARTQAFENLSKLSTRVINALIAGGIPAAKVEDARTFGRKISGQRAGAKAPQNAGETPETGAIERRSASVSQQSYDSRANFFRLLAGLADGEPGYKPNEAGLTKEALQAKVQELYDCNEKMAQAAHAWRFALIERDNLLYLGAPCIADCTAMMKAYIKTLDGTTSPVYKAVSGLMINRLIK